MTTESPRTSWKRISFFLLWLLQGLYFLWQAGLHRAAASRLAPLIGLLLALWCIIFLALLVLEGIGRSPEFARSLFAHQKRTALVSLMVLLFSAIPLLYGGLFAGDELARVRVYLEILKPVFSLLVLASLEVLLQLVWEKKPSFSRDVLQKSLAVFSVVFALAGTVAFTRLGIDPVYKGDWARGLPAVPVLEWQILLAVSAGLILYWAEARDLLQKMTRADFLLCIAIWGLAAGLWLSQPIIPNASALKPHEPNFEIYPFIDSQTYDNFAQSALVGEGYGGSGIPQRPLYIVFLTLSHALVGQPYENVIFVQTLLLAFFPVLLYLFGREFIGRPVGLAAALLAIFRDYISNLVSPFTGNLSLTKVYLSEIPTAMLILLALIAAMRWIRSGFPLRMGFWIGGFIGTAMLLRTQAVVVLPVLFLFAWIHDRTKWKMILLNVVVTASVVMLIASPWLVRNWALTGRPMFDSPESQTINLALRYSRVNGIEPQVMPLPGESNAEYGVRLRQTAREAILQNPVGAVTAIWSSFLNHCVNNVLLFPLQDEIHSAGELIVPAEAFWEKWEGQPTLPQSVILVLYLLLLCIGVTTAWQRIGWLGLMPLALNLLYNLWTSLALLSGQRFMLTMDWSIYIYYLIGLFSLLSWIPSLWSGKSFITLQRPGVEQSASRDNRLPLILGGVFFFAVGSSLVAVEHMFPVRYPDTFQRQAMNRLFESNLLNGGQTACIQTLMQNDELTLLSGRALYPRYYIAGDGEKFTDSVGYRVTDEGRMVFDVVGQRGGRVILPMSEMPQFFPNASDVTLMYGPGGDVWFAYVELDGRNAFYASDLFDPALCP